MFKFELSEFDKIALDNCDQDIKTVFEKSGSGFHVLLPSLIQLNRNLKIIGKALNLLAEQGDGAEHSSNNSKES